MIRQCASMLGALSLVAALVPAGALAAQSRSGEDVPRLMVVPFRSNVKALGSEMFDNVIQRIAADVSARQMVVVSKTSVCANLEASGFSCDSAPDQLTSKLLAHSLRTEEYLEGTITKTGNVMHVETVFYVTDFVDASQVLPAITSAKMNAITDSISRNFQAARKSVPDFTACMNSLRAGNYDAAIASARTAIGFYANATAARVCMASALVKKNAPSDSIIAVAGKVVTLDPYNKLALGIVAEEYRKRGATFKAAGKADSADVYVTKAVESWARLIEADPRNVSLVQDVVSKIAISGKAQKALPIINRAVENNPGDPDLVKLQWQLLLAAASSAKDTSYLRQAVKVGDDMVKVDTSAADTTYFIRQAAAFAQLGEVPKAAATTTAGINKFPLNPSLWALNSQIQRLAGNPQGAADAATKLIALDVSNGHAYLLLAQAEIDLQRPDQAVQAIRDALSHHSSPKAGADSAHALTQAKDDSVLAGRLMLVLGNQAYKSANAANPAHASDYKRAVSMLSFTDSIAPSAQAKFLKGVSAFRLGDLDVRENQGAKRCDLAREAQDYFLIAQLNIAAGGSVEPKTAQQLLGFLAQYSPAVDGQIKKYCK